jgi:hypothetical protein
MTMTIGVAALAIVFAAARPSTPEPATSVRLSSLKPACSLVKRWVGAVPALPEGLWIACGSEAVLVVHPLNLLGHVDIASPEQALEFLRLFSSEETYSLFPCVSAVEVRSSSESERDFNELSPEVFAKHFRPASARQIGGTRPSPEGGGCCGGRQYEVRRTLLFPDGTVRERVEVVFQDGYTSKASEKIVIKRGSIIGLQYF